MYLLVQLTVDQQSQEGAQVANDEKKSSYVALLSPSVLLADGWEAPSTIWVLKRSEVGSGEGRSTQGLRPGKPLGRALWVPTPPPISTPPILEKGPSPSLGNRPNCCQTSERRAWTHTCCWRLLRATAYLHPPVLLGVAVSLPPADWSEEVEGRQRAGLLLPFWVGGLGEEDEGAETEK